MSLHRIFTVQTNVIKCANGKELMFCLTSRCTFDVEFVNCSQDFRAPLLGCSTLPYLNKILIFEIYFNDTYSIADN